MNNGQMDCGKSNPAFALMIEENHEKTRVRLVGTGIWTKDVPNASLMHYHRATLLSDTMLFPDLLICISL